MQLVKILTEPGDLVVDPFLGSGTTAVACVQTGRRFVGGDVDGSAVRISRARLTALAGAGRRPVQALRNTHAAANGNAAFCRSRAEQDDSPERADPLQTIPRV